MQETPNPTWAARLIFALSVLVALSGTAFLALPVWFFSRSDIQHPMTFLVSLGLPAAIALLSWAFYYTALGNVRAQDSMVLRKAVIVYIAYLALALPTLSLCYYFAQPK